MKDKIESPVFVLMKIISWPFKSFFRILIVVIVVGLYVYQSVTVDRLAREIRMLEFEQKRLQNQKANLETEIVQLSNINRIEKIAKEKFDLINDGAQLENLVIKKFEKKSDPVVNESVQLAGVK